MASNSTNTSGSNSRPSDSGSTSGNNTAISITISIVLIVVGGIVTVIVAFLIYKCVKKHLRRRKREEFQSGKASSTDEGTTPNNFETSGATVGFSQVELESMDRFLAEILKERPIKFTAFHLKSFTENFSEKIGSGGFGVVYKGQLPNGMPIAVKVLNNMDKRAEEQFMAEVGTIGRTYHLHLVRLYGFCFEPTIKALVYEYMENGSLEKHLFSSEKKIGFDKLYEIAIGTAKGIRYLHEECQQRIVHYDIKPTNVLLTVSFSPKIADFGLAKLFDRENTHFTITGARGTPGYAAPELWIPLPVTHKCDVYSFGMLLFEIIGRRRNFDLELQSKEWYPRWVRKKFEIGEMDVVLTTADIEEKYREKAERMCKVAFWCVQYRPDDRPTMSSVVRMLEGQQEIEDPADPFQYLVAHNPESITTSSTGTTADYSSSAALASSSL